LVFGKPSDNELGEYLPDGEAEVKEGSEYIEAKTKPEAQEKCEEIASQYGATDSEVEPLENDGDWNCKFKFWG
jgi:hypothetical protein